MNVGRLPLGGILGVGLLALLCVTARAEDPIPRIQRACREFHAPNWLERNFVAKRFERHRREALTQIQTALKDLQKEQSPNLPRAFFQDIATCLAHAVLTQTFAKNPAENQIHWEPLTATLDFLGHLLQYGHAFENHREDVRVDFTPLRRALIAQYQSATQHRLAALAGTLWNLVSPFSWPSATGARGWIEPVLIEETPESEVWTTGDDIVEDDDDEDRDIYGSAWSPEETPPAEEPSPRSRGDWKFDTQIFGGKGVPSVRIDRASHRIRLKLPAADASDFEGVSLAGIAQKMKKRFANGAWVSLPALDNAATETLTFLPSSATLTLDLSLLGPLYIWNAPLPIARHLIRYERPGAQVTNEQIGRWTDAFNQNTTRPPDCGPMLVRQSDSQSDFEG